MLADYDAVARSGQCAGTPLERLAWTLPKGQLTHRTIAGQRSRGDVLVWVSDWGEGATSVLQALQGQEQCERD
jgi:hypothetical protein